MPAWRCPSCLINWPAHQEFDDCPVPDCGTNTEAIRNVKPDYTLDEALDMAKHYKFEKFMANWDATHDPERLVPTAEDHVKYPFQPELGNRVTYGERKAEVEAKRVGLHGSRKT